MTIYNQQSAMQRKPGERSHSFLEKFEGKKNAVGKEGLIHLLQQKLQSLAHSPKVIISNRNPMSQKLQPQPTPSKKKQMTSRVQPTSPVVDRETPKIVQAERYSLRKQQPSSLQLPSRKTQTENINETKSNQPIGSKLKLPSINSIVKNQSQSLHSRNILIPSLNTESKSSKMNPLGRKPGQGQSMVLNNFDKLLQMDGYALKHLQSLDKFEKHLIKQKLDNATRSALSEPK